MDEIKILQKVPKYLHKKEQYIQSTNRRKQLPNKPLRCTSLQRAQDGIVQVVESVQYID